MSKKRAYAPTPLDIVEDTVFVPLIDAKASKIVKQVRAEKSCLIQMT